MNRRSHIPGQEMSYSCCKFIPVGPPLNFALERRYGLMLAEVGSAHPRATSLDCTWSRKRGAWDEPVASCMYLAGTQ
ncbi:origin recognition complex subunit Orc1 [Aspergillus luchuensis]|uniref:Origin recognition complex subunit Orc1 n=1 Tax=Aspergillus kawachii TaxID=1069201 RepID=A0A146F2Y4_ASPKA|nr:origin recognition complex subunit Orc1 [Aspergillus luchuensis]